MNAARALLAAAWALLAAAAARAHDVSGTPPAWDLRWSFEPWVVVCLVLSLLGYALGLRRLWQHAGRGRGITRTRAAAFIGGWCVLAVALVSPLDPLGGRLFSLHMVQHELLMVLAAPLMVLGRPLGVWAWALSLPARRRLGASFHHPAWRVPWQQLSAPLAAWGVHAAALWMWHVPAWFEAALANNALHALQHASFLFSALLFWWSVLGSNDRAANGIALASVFTTMLHTAALGALLSLSSSVWYPTYIASSQALGVDALEDLQLGGLVMWVPAGLAYLVSGLVLAARMIGGRAKVTV